MQIKRFNVLFVSAKWTIAVPVNTSALLLLAGTDSTKVFRRCEMSEKPILFSTPMVQAILDGRKTQTRRVMKPQPTLEWAPHSCGEVHKMKDGIFVLVFDEPVVIGWGASNVDGDEAHKSPYQPGDVLWVRETWKYYEKAVGKGEEFHVEQRFAYKADESDYEEGRPVEWYDGKWRPSIHMPRDAARIFLRVTDVRAERLQEISGRDVMHEGINPHWWNGEPERWNNEQRRAFQKLWNKHYAAPKPVKSNGVITHYESYPWSYPWEDIREVREHKGLKWYVIGNPWIWVYTFERIQPEGV